MEISLAASQRSYGVGYPPPPGGGPGQAGLQTLATDLGVSADDLTRARTSGQTLSDLATSKGIGQDALRKAVEDSIRTSAPAGAPALSSDQLSAMATDMINRKPGAGGGHHHHHAGGGVGGVQMPDGSLLGALSGVTPTEGASATDATTLTRLLQNLTSSPDPASPGDSNGSNLQDLLEQVRRSSSGYGSDGATPALSGSLGLNAIA